MGSASVFLRALYRRLKLIGTRRTSGMAASVGALSILVLAAPAMSQGIVDYDFWDLQPTVITNFADAAAKGVWGDMIDHVPDAERIPPPTVHASEYYPVHGALLREGTRGKLVFFANRTNDLMFLYDLNTAMPSATVYRTDPDTNLGPGEPYNVHRMFCAGHAFLPDGNLVIFGQHFGIDAPPSGNDGICDHSGFIGVANCDQGEDPSPGIICNCYTVPSPPAASIFDIEDASNGGLGKVYRIEDMPVLSHAYGGSDSSRYYPGGATLPSGNILVVGGNFWTDPSGDCCVLDEDPNYPFNRNWIELDSQTLSWSQVTNPMDPSWVNNDAYRMGMPHDYGKVMVLPAGLAWLGWPQESWGTGSSKARLWPWPWPATLASVVSTSNIKNENRAYTCPVILTLEPPYSLEQKVAVFGGGGAEENFVAVANCEYVDFASPTPAWTSMSALNTARARADAVLLPDGNVLVVGGGDYVSGAGPWQAVKESEMFYPATETFVPMDSNQGERIYHSQALLLPDGRVVASGNDRAQTFGGYLDGDTYEIYWPPYLFTSSGWAARPTIDTFDGNVHYGQPMFVDYTKPSGTTIEDVVLVAPGAVTHGLNFSQRRATMEFVDDGSTITATAPWAPEVAPPGDYLLFIVTDGGVPSEGKFVRLSPATSTAVTGSRTVWGGTVRLGSTFTVEDGDSLVVLSGTRVYADKDADPPVRLQVNGMIDVQGGAGAAEVLFSSYDPATGDLDTGAWGGLEFHLDGAEDAYGYFGSLEPPSSIVGAAIAHADTAIRFTDLCAPTLEDIRFENITSGIDILLDDTDVMIPSGYWDPPPPDADSLLHEVPAEWVFADTLDVRATSSSSNDWGWPGGTWGTVDEPGKPDLLVQGRMAVSGVVPNTFLPEVPASPSLGSDWGGITFMTPSSGNRLYNAHVSGAVNPVRVIAVDQSAGTEVKNCLIEQFRDVGVGIKGSQYVEVSGCTIRRGGNMLAEAEDVAETGISIEESAPRIDDNTIFDTEDVGIQIMNATGPSKFECIAVPANPESLLVTGNQIEAGSHSVGSANGIDASWICAFYEAQVQENYIEHWGGAGIKMHQCVNTKVSCNEIRDCGISFRYERTDLADQPPVRLQHNNLQDCATDLVHTDSGKKLKLGPSTAYTGSNRLDMEGGNELFVRQNDPSSESSHRLNAESCAWAVNEADADSATVIQYVDGQSPLIPKVELDATPPSWQNAQIMCLPQDQTPEQEARLAGGPNESQVPWETDPSRSVADLPFVPGLQVVGPNPARGPVSLLLGVQGAQEHISVTVYDVSGRRVRTIRSGVLPGGMHRLVWNLRDDGGNLAAPGAYFVRTQRSANVENHKIIVVR